MHAYLSVELHTLVVVHHLLPRPTRICGAYQTDGHPMAASGKDVTQIDERADATLEERPERESTTRGQCAQRPAHELEMEAVGTAGARTADCRSLTSICRLYSGVDSDRNRLLVVSRANSDADRRVNA